MKKQILLLAAVLVLAFNYGKSQCSASFTYTLSSNGQINCTSTSTGTSAGTRYTWFTGDGNRMPNVSDTAAYTYCYNGTYTVSLLIQDSLGGCSDSVAQSVTISNAANTTCLPANFTYTVSGGQVTCSLGSPTAYNRWNFGDYMGYNYNASTIGHNYTQNGTYTVTCITQYQYGNYNVYLSCDTFQQVVTVSGVPCVASFWADSNNTNNKLYVYNTSQGANSVYYSANGGAWVAGNTINWGIDSFMNLPAGNNTICQKIIGNGCADSVCQTVFVNCMISETHTVGCGQVAFTTSGNPGITSAAWYIGGSQVSTQINPTITFTNTSSFYLSYTLQTSLCTKTDSVYIQVGPVTPVFYVYPDSIAGPHNWLIYVDNQPNYATYNWSWGDGTTSTSAFPAHTYSTAGWYNICLTVHDFCGDSASSCQNDSMFRTSSTMIGITVQPMNPNTVSVATNQRADLNVYPVPATDQLILENTGATRAELFDNEGRKVLSEILSNGKGKASLNIQSLSSGFYLLKVYTANGILQKKIIKQ